MPVSDPTSQLSRRSLLGRSQTLDQLRALLVTESLPVVVTGPPGVGKTALVSTAAAAALQDGVVAAVWWCDVQHARDQSGLLALVGSAAGVGVLDGELHEVVQRLERRAVAAGNAVLVLDAAEVASEPSAALVDAIRCHAPSVSVFVTSRAPLPTPDTTVVRVEPLAVEDAVALFRQRSFETSGARLNDADESTVRTLVVALDCLPLAVELAAGRSALLAPGQLLARLQDRFRLLRTMAGGPETLPSMKSALDVSWELLDPTQQSVVRACSMFQGTFTLEDVEAILADSLPGDVWLLDVIESLYACCWLQSAPPVPTPTEDARGPVQFRLLATMREYVAESEAEDALLLRRTMHSGWVRTRLAALEPGLDTASDREALAAFELLRADVRFAIAWAFVHAPEDAVAIGLLTERFLAVLGPYPEHLELLGRLLEPAAKAHQRAVLHARAARLMHAAVRGLPPIHEEDVAAVAAAPPSDEAAVEHLRHIALGATSLVAGDHDGALAAFTTARDLAVSAGLASREAQAYVWRGMARVQQVGPFFRSDDAFAGAVRDYQAAIDRFSRTGGSRQLGAVLANLGNVFARTGRLEEQRHYHEEALRHVRRAGHRLLEAAVLLNLGWLALQEGRHADAQRLLDESLVQQLEVGRHPAVTHVRVNLGVLAADQRREQEALAHLIEAAAGCVGPSTRWLLADIEWWQGVVVFEHGRARDAMPRLLAACRLSQEAGQTSRAILAARTAVVVATTVGAEHSLSQEVLALAMRDHECDHLPQIGVVISLLHQLARVEVDDADQPPPPVAALRRSPECRVLHRILRHRRGQSSGGRQAVPAGLAIPDAITVFAADGTGWIGPDLRVVDLRRRRVLRRLCAALAVARVENPGLAMSLDEIVAAVWPGERLVGDSGANRVYVAVATLRQLGLEGVLNTRAGGYLLEPRSCVVGSVPALDSTP